jgi:hypothetical protein
VFKTMKYLVTDHAVIPQAYQGQSLSREDLVP